MSQQRKLISIVTPCFNEEATVEECYRTVRQLFADHLPDYDYEHIFADNASTDRTLELLKELAQNDPRVKIIVNARNYGSNNSLFNAILSAEGDAVLTMLAADLQDPPELLPEFVKHWENGYEVVYGIRAKREERWSMSMARRVFYTLVSTFSEITLPRNVGEFQLVDRKIIQALRSCDDYYPYIRGLLTSFGFKAVGIPYTWRERKHGTSKAWTLSLIDQALNGLISFSKVPLRFCLVIGLLLSMSSVAFAVFALIANLVATQQIAPPGIPTLIVGLFFLSGVQLFFLGVLGEYIMAIHFQVRKRPLVVERERINFPDPTRKVRPRSSAEVDAA